MEHFTEVFDLYRERVIGWCYRVSKDRETAQDLAQEVFLKAWRHREAFRGDSSVSSWLYAITRNHCLTSLRKQSRSTIPLDLACHSSLGDLNAVAPDRAAENGQRYQSLNRLMARTLDPVEVRVMTLHYGHDVPLATITRELDLSNPSGAKAYIVNARRKLRQRMRGTTASRSGMRTAVRSHA